MFGRSQPSDDAGLESGADEGIQHESSPSHSHSHSHSDRTLTNDLEPTKAQLKRATRTRLCWALLTSLLLLISVVFIILVELGSTGVKPVIKDIYFLKLNLANIIPLTVPDAVLINSIAQSLGLSDIYTVGLWGYCEGNPAISQCSTPRALYWFNPVEIIQSELLSGASIELPAQVTTILGLIHVISNWMFGLFLAGVCLSFVMMFLVPLSVFTRWATFPLMLLTFFAALCTTVAAVIATALAVIATNAVTSVSEINIGASVGVEMVVFMWIGAGAAIVAWLIMLGQCCCCASRRDVKKGKKTGSKKAWTERQSPAQMSEKPHKEKRGMFGRKKEETAEETS